MSFQSFPARMGSEGLGFWGMASSGGQRQTHYRLPLVSVSVCGDVGIVEWLLAWQMCV